MLRALGASPTATITDGLFGVMGALVVGALLAGAVALALSPLAPLGPVRRVEHASIAFDWAALGLGLAALIVVLSSIAVVIAYRQAPHRVARRRQRSRRGSRTARTASNAGLSTPAVTGIRFALEPGAGPETVPVRSAIVGAVLALVVVISTLTFGTSLERLVSHPELYGWNWSYQLVSGFSGQEDLPQKQVTTLLDRDPYVSAWSEIYFSSADLDGKSVAVIATSPGAAVEPPLLSGHGLEKPDEVVLGPATLAQLHKHLGDTVLVGRGAHEADNAAHRGYGHHARDRERNLPHDHGNRRPVLVSTVPRQVAEPAGQHGARPARSVDTGPQDSRSFRRAALAATDQSRPSTRARSRRRVASPACCVPPRSSTTARWAGHRRCSARRWPGAPSPR